MRAPGWAAVITFSFAACVLAETAPPSVSSIDPKSGPVAGGFPVTITGDNLDIPSNFACILPCPTRVFFGDMEGVAKEWTDERLVVIAPRHDPGTVDVTLRTTDGRTTTVPEGFTFTSSGETGYQTILLPLYIDDALPGAYGSLWKTELWLRNNGSNPVAIAPAECPPDQACPAIFPLTATLMPGASLRNLPQFAPHPATPGRLVYVTRAGAHAVAMQLRVFDVSRLASNRGTEVPIVREENFLSGPVTLLNVPISSRFRQTLRLYDMRELPAGESVKPAFRVRVYSQQEGTVAEVLEDFTLVATSEETGTFRQTPLFAQSGNLSDGIVTADDDAAVRVDIEPLTAGSRYFAMINVTSNDTQQVTIVSPQ
jgi:hypothetical protein